MKFYLLQSFAQIILQIISLLSTFDTARVSLAVVTLLLSPCSIILTRLTLRHELKSKQKYFLRAPPLKFKYFSVSVIIFGQFKSHLDVSRALVRNRSPPASSLTRLRFI